ncbi:polysaccharide lyase [Polaribacter litorisediminis]|uniref:heparin lyase I family protein n=1 Tax=Polaribacter litorisediminis TaxID=1908341 RepID=UPI001CBB5D4C|nr:heparin lyase I family protein [Polaribacter litorisediminis]UAM97667.1 polysaccharide lyase [Polaribacter litorisediminis]
MKQFFNKTIKTQHLVIFLLFCVYSLGYGQIKLEANGKGKTYELINSVLINEKKIAVEVPDCSHEDFGRHISEKFDSDLNKYVFEFIIHIKNDNDRCKKTNRQRNEIKATKKSNEIILAKEGEKLNYKWKFKLEEDFQVSKSYTDLHQIRYHKEDGNEPLFIFTAKKRKGEPKFEVVYIKNGEKEILQSIKLSKLTNQWILAEETISYAKNGTYSLILKTLDGNLILKIENNNIQTWFETMNYAIPKWGIYRSLKHADQLKDEKVYFADFEINNLKIDK